MKKSLIFAIVGFVVFVCLSASAGAAATTVTREIQVEDDDVEEFLNTETYNGGYGPGSDREQGHMYMDSSDLELGSDNVGGTFWQVIAVQYDMLAIPQGATIYSAKITFTIDNPGARGVSNDFTILAEAADNASVFSTDDFNVTDRARSAASVSWAPDAFPATGTTLDTPDISVLIQEVVNRPGWSDNNRLTLMIYPDVYLALPDPMTGGPTTVQEIEFEAGPGDGAALLHIEWVLGDATGPNPPDGQIDVSRDTDLSWTAGVLAAASNGQTLYFSESFDDVNDGVGGITQTATSHDPGQLNYGTTYYWRVRQNNGAPDFGVNESRVWSFTTEPIVYPVDGANIAATASSSDPGQGPENTVNGSGLDVNDLDLHSDELTAMWITAMGAPGPAWIQYDFDKVYKLAEMWVWNHNGGLESAIGLGFKDVTVEYSTNGTDFTTLGTTHEFARAPGAVGYAANTAVDFGGTTAKHVRLTVNSNWGGILPQYGLSEVRFFSIPVLAREPSPDSGATDVGVDATLNWRAGREAAEHNVYLSADEQAVIDGTAPVVTVTDASYSTSLDVDSTYYWRVDEVNGVEIPATWQGDIWSFSTQEFLVVDDFESYNDLDPDDPDSNRIFNAWIDGYEQPANGSVVGYAAAPFTEQSIVHSGGQSMPLAYDNTGAAGYSEAERTFDVGQNWTRAGAATLVLYFHGAEGNTGQLYVKVNGSKMVYDGDAGDIAKVEWKQWNIDLALLGRDLQNVTKLSIGIDGNGASGTLYIDDIRLYRSAPAPEAP